MAKKKSHEINQVSSAEAVTNHVNDLEQLPASEQSMPANEPTHPLMEEVQSFLNLRNQLAKKLAVEIEAMEEKLAELKKTVASLFPTSDGDSTGDRKAKKPKAKVTSHKEKPETLISSDQAPATGE